MLNVIGNIILFCCPLEFLSTCFGLYFQHCSCCCVADHLVLVHRGWLIASCIQLECDNDNTASTAYIMMMAYKKNAI